MVSNWRNTSFSKNIYCDICNICKEDSVRWKLKAWSWVHRFISQTMISLSQLFIKNKSWPKSKIISRFKSSAFEYPVQNISVLQGGKDCFQIYYFTTNLLHKKLVLFDILVVWLMKPKVRNWNNSFSAKQR